MAQDTDVARVAAALRAPAIKYRSFGNEPDRNAATAATGDFTLLSAGLSAAAAVAAPAPNPPEIWTAPVVSDASLGAPRNARDSYPSEPFALDGARWAEPSVPETRREPPAPSWAEPAQPSWTEPPPPTWSATAEQGNAWPNPAVAAWPVPSPAAEPWPAAPAPQPLAAPPAWSPSLPPAMPEPAPVFASPSIAPPVQLAAAPMLASLAQPAPPASMPATLLAAAETINSATIRPALSTLAEIGTAPPPVAPPVAARPVAPALFPLIEALDLPGGFVARRAATPVSAALPAPAPALPQAAAAVTMPLPELFRLLAAGPTLNAPAFALLRGHPARALGYQT